MKVKFRKIDGLACLCGAARQVVKALELVQPHWFVKFWYSQVALAVVKQAIESVQGRIVVLVLLRHISPLNPVRLHWKVN